MTNCEHSCVVKYVNMWKGVSVLFAISLVLTNGEPVARSLRNGEFNRYYLFNSAVSGVQMSLTAVSTDLLANVDTVVIVHGHGGSYQTSLNPDVTREILESEDYNINVITVDWSITASLSYDAAKSSVISVGEFLAAFLTTQNIEPATLHLVGFNLGAHIVGEASRRLGGVARITGLDPSPSDVRLSNRDANYVEVIHTDTAGVNANGIEEQLGHADFYPNGGRVQPGCANALCRHERAWLYFSASIRDNTFRANCCNTLREKDSNTCRGTFLEMGNNRLRKIPCPTGIYRVNTRNAYPF